MPRKINFTVSIYTDDKHSTILFRSKFSDTDSISNYLPMLNKHFVYNIFKSKPKKIGRNTLAKLERVSIMRCETDKEGKQTFMYWNRKNGADELTE